MKNSKKLAIPLLAVLMVSSCATAPSQNYTPEPYIEDISRFPANEFSCWESMKKFLTPKKKTAAVVDVGTATPGGKKITAAMAKSPTRYPKGFEDVKGAHIQYGFESEYLHDETEVLLKSYMPAPPFYTDTKEAWLKMTPEQRLETFDTLIAKSRNEKDPAKQLFAYRSKGKLIKIADDPELSDALPDSFVYDAGHFEIVLDPHNSAEEIIKKIKVINKNLGVGSMQMTISNPLNKPLLQTSAAARAELKSELVGYYNFMNDFDTLSKLEVGYERYLKDPKIQSVKSFNHPWLGPMTKLKHDKLENLVDGIVDGKNFSEEELKQMSYLVVSHKFIGGLSFRPDVAYKKGRLASEVRDCHQNVKCIEDRIIRETYFLMKGKESFKSFSSLEQFDTIKNFNDIHPDDVKYMLKDLFPSYGSFTQTELQLFRNFSYPFRDWSQHIANLGKPGLEAQVANAQVAYTEALKKIMFDYKAKTITKAEAQTQVMGALAEFSKKSGLVDAMKAKYNQLLDPTEIKNFDILKFTFLIRSGQSIALVSFYETKLTA